MQITERFSGPIRELRTLSTTDLGTALTTTAGQIYLPAGTKRIYLMPRNYTTAITAKVAAAPYLKVIKDVAGVITDYSENAQDGDAGTDVTLSSLATAANGGYLYLGFHRKIAGVRVDVDAANATASVLTAQYLNGKTWTALTITDGTASGGATLAQDGTITWTSPTSWRESPLKGETLYWMRFKVSAALDASTTLNSLLAIPRYYGELLSGQAFEFAGERNPRGYSHIEALTVAGTANLVVMVDGIFE